MLYYANEVQLINQTCAHLMFFQDIHRNRHQVQSSCSLALKLCFHHGCLKAWSSALCLVCRGVRRGLASCAGCFLCRDVVPLRGGGRGCSRAQERYPQVFNFM